MKRRILGISRSTRFSPHSENRDAAIFAAVANRLNRGQNEVSTISEDLFVAIDLTDFDLVFSMARGSDVLETLAKAEEEDGLKVVNSSRSLLRLSRASIVALLSKSGLPIPCAQVGSPEELSRAEIPYPMWLKRADACAQQQGDVCLVHNEKEKQEALERFSRHNTLTLVAEEHLDGDLVKFYGVEGTDFFSLSYPTSEGGFSKFGLEEANGVPHHYAFSREEMKQTADDIARLTGMTIYGGDAIVQADGSFKVIDFNDWPSFSSCRKEAAKAIASRINQM